MNFDLLDPGDDTSQDAADLSSQEAKDNEIVSPAVEEGNVDLIE